MSDLEENSKFPDLDDMMKAGMSLSEALEFWNRMMSGRHLGDAHWWRLLSPSEERARHMSNAPES